MSLHGGTSIDGKKRWKSESVKMETDYGEVVLIAPCGERRNMHPDEARSLALRLQDMAKVAEHELVAQRQERASKRNHPSKAGSLH